MSNRLNIRKYYIVIRSAHQYLQSLDLFELYSPKLIKLSKNEYVKYVVGRYAINLHYFQEQSGGQFIIVQFINASIPELFESEEEITNFIINILNMFPALACYGGIYIYVLRFLYYSDLIRVIHLLKKYRYSEALSEYVSKYLVYFSAGGDVFIDYLTEEEKNMLF